MVDKVAVDRWRCFSCPAPECGALVFTNSPDAELVLCPFCREVVAVTGASDMEDETWTRQPQSDCLPSEALAQPSV